MASEEVIELGSSDDEPEPKVPKPVPPKKVMRKHPPNAMVHIPKGITIKPKENVQVTKPKGPVNVKQELCGKNVKNPFAANYTQKPIKILNGGISVLTNIAPTVPKKTSYSKVTSSKLPSMAVKAASHVNASQQSQTCLTKLPPGITVTRTTGQPKRKQKTAPSSNVIIKRRMVENVPTVELMDDEKPESTQTAKWYMRPEDYANKTLEDTNNAEPKQYVEITIEDSPIKPPIYKNVSEIGKELPITIEESPIKKIVDKNKQSKDISGSEDENEKKDRNKRNSKKKLNYPTDSNVENKEQEHNDFKTGTNYKSAEYLKIKKQNEDNNNDKNKGSEKESSSNMEVDSSDRMSIEIEVPPVIVTVEDSPMKVVPSLNENQTKQESQESSLDISDVNRENIQLTKKPVKCSKENVDDVIKKNDSDDVIKKNITGDVIKEKVTDKPVKCSKENVGDVIKETVTDVLKENDTVEEDSEFHPVYQSFINLCFQLENSDDMKKIVDKKIKNYYRQVPKEYSESEEFIEMVSSKIVAMKAGPDKLYLYIKDIVDELNMQRKIAKSQKPSVEQEKVLVLDKNETDKSEVDSKRQRQIRKLEKTVKKLHRAIQKLEEQEVDFDDEEDSVYLLTERYKERMVRVYAKLCQLSGTKLPSEPRVHIDPRSGRPSGPSQRLEKWINKKVPVGAPLPFPDFHDVLRCVKQANEEDKLGMNDVEIMEEARDLFTRCGRKLQRRRQENEWRIAASRIQADLDPAENSEDLKRKLEDNKKLAATKETELINKYADKQSQLKLEGEEIGDKEAEESPHESDDEDVEEVLEERLLQPNSIEKDQLNNKKIYVPVASVSGERNKNTLKNEQATNELNDNVVISDVDSDVCIAKNITAETSSENETQKDNPDSVEKMKIDCNAEESLDLQQTQSQPVANISKTITAETSSENETHKYNPDSVGKMEIDCNDEETCDLQETRSEPVANALTEDVRMSDENANKNTESEGDEMDLLQKTHSESDFHVSTLDSADSDIAIAISDTGESSENKLKYSSDVVSIENSSYSETEVDVYHKQELSAEVIRLNRKTIIENKTTINPEVRKRISNSNDEYEESVENILLASSEESDSDDQNELTVSKDDNDIDKVTPQYINAKCDIISIGDTLLKGHSVVNIDLTETKDKEGHYVVNIDLTETKDNVKSNNKTVTNEEVKRVEKEIITSTQYECDTENDDMLSIKSNGDAPMIDNAAPAYASTPNRQNSPQLSPIEITECSSKEDHQKDLQCDNESQNSLYIDMDDLFKHINSKQPEQVQRSKDVCNDENKVFSSDEVESELELLFGTCEKSCEKSLQAEANNELSDIPM